MKSGLVKLVLVMLIFLLICFNNLSLFALAKSPAYNFRVIETNRDSLGMTFEDVNPGDKIFGILQLSLLDDIPTVFNVEILDDYSYRLKKMAVSEEELNYYSYLSWIKLIVNSPVHLLGLGKLEIPFEINVPEGASPGDYSGTIVATLDSYGDKAIEKISSPELDKVGSGTKVVLGLAIRFLLRVNGEVDPNVIINTLSYYVEKVSNKFAFVLSYENNGNVAVVPKAVINIKNFWQRDVFSGDFKLPMLLPYKSNNAHIKLSTSDFYFRYGIYDLSIDIYYDVFNREIGENLVYYAGKVNMKIYHFPSYFFIVFILLFLLILLFIFKKYVFLIFYLKRSKEYIVKENDTLQSIASKYSVNPKTLIFLNNIKAPYFLFKDQKIFIPITKKNEEKKSKNPK
jgi:hypothetical protein